MRSNDRWLGPIFCSPALLLLTFSVALPFMIAVGITFTDQRLLSPNDTRFVGFDNYQRLLALDILAIPKVQDDVPATDGSAADDGGVVALRKVLRSRAGYEGYRRLTSIDVGTTSYAIVATDPIFYRSLVNTFRFVAMVIPLQCGLALLLALLVNQRFPGRTIFRTIYFAPVVTSMVVVAVMWTLLYNTDEGLVNQGIQWFAGGSVNGPAWLNDERYAMPAVAIMSAWQGAGFQMLIFLAGLQSIDPVLYEAARMDGANTWQRFRHVTLPGLRNTMVFIIISTTIYAFGLFTQIDVMTQGGPNDSTSTLVFHAVRTGYREQDVAYGSTVAVIFFIVVLSITLFQRVISERKDES